MSGFNPYDLKGYYILDGHVAVPCRDLIDWAIWYETADRHVASTEIGVLWVSTVFLGLDHNWCRFAGDDAPPILFETMIFGDDSDQYQTRCAGWEEAEEMHSIAVLIATDRVRKADATIRKALSSNVPDAHRRDSAADA